MKNEKPVPAKTRKLIYQEANSACAFCNETDLNVLEIHHIEKRTDGGNNDPENLILVCSNCHSKITNDTITVYEVFRAKLRLQSQPDRKQPTRAASNVISFDRSTNTGIVANNLKISTSKKSIKVQPPIGTISSDRDKRNYIKYLIDRYNDYKKADKNIENFKYGMIYAAINREFKCKWDYVPIERFADLAAYLQDRIDKTILGKTQKSRGIRNYRRFDEYIT